MTLTRIRVALGAIFKLRVVLFSQKHFSFFFRESIIAL